MKSLCFAVALGIWMVAATPVAQAQDRVVRLDVPGMNCPACPATVKMGLQRLDGVSVTAVDLKSRTAEVVVHEAAVTDRDLTDATAAVGFPSTVVREPSDDGVLQR